MSKSSPAASRYARALFLLAEERQLLAPVQADMESVVRLIQASPEFAAFIGNPVLPPARRQAALREIFQGRLQAVTSQFLGLLAEKRRLAELPQVAEAFLALCRERGGTVRVSVVSAVELDSAQQQRLVEKLAARLGKKIEATTTVDPSLIGGFRVQVGDEVIDSSLLSRLDAFRQKVLAAS
jgi:F-type H+-transporting ATPase subunit delta